MSPHTLNLGLYSECLLSLIHNYTWVIRNCRIRVYKNSLISVVFVAWEKCFAADCPPKWSGGSQNVTLLNGRHREPARPGLCLVGGTVRGNLPNPRPAGMSLHAECSDLIIDCWENLNLRWIRLNEICSTSFSLPCSGIWWLTAAVPLLGSCRFEHAVHYAIPVAINFGIIQLFYYIQKYHFWNHNLLWSDAILFCGMCVFSWEWHDKWLSY